jgi:hypothetical protein
VSSGVVFAMFVGLWFMDVSFLWTGECLAIAVYCSANRVGLYALLVLVCYVSVCRWGCGLVTDSGYWEVGRGVLAGATSWTGLCAKAIDVYYSRVLSLWY